MKIDDYHVYNKLSKLLGTLSINTKYCLTAEAFNSWKQERAKHGVKNNTSPRECFWIRSDGKSRFTVANGYFDIKNFYSSDIIYNSKDDSFCGYYHLARFLLDIDNLEICDAD